MLQSGNNNMLQQEKVGGAAAINTQFSQQQCLWSCLIFVGGENAHSNRSHY
ncbi:hypothetical protein O9992_21990 [Vibrio lentus]|nr:hypothetical protein [Vibrio lentus]